MLPGDLTKTKRNPSWEFLHIRWGRIRPTESGHTCDGDCESSSRRPFLGMGDHVTWGFNQNKKESFMGIFTHPVGPNPAYRIRSHLRRGLRIRVATSIFGDGGWIPPPRLEQSSHIHWGVGPPVASTMGASHPPCDAYLESPSQVQLLGMGFRVDPGRNVDPPSPKARGCDADSQSASQARWGHPIPPCDWGTDPPLDVACNPPG